jgi:uncharacterized protein (DUF433 family)
LPVLLAFTLDHAARVSGVSERRIRYWDETGVLHPSLVRGESREPYGRIYSFRDLLGLRTLGELRDRFHVPLQQLRAVGERLSKHYETPWTELRFYVQGSHLYFHDPDHDLLVSAIKPGQVPLALGLDLERVAVDTERRASQLLERDRDDFGTIVRRRHVLGNRPVLAGTRIPTSAIWDFHQAGYSFGEIAKQYPRLKQADIEQAIKYEQERRQLPRAG